MNAPKQTMTATVTPRFINDPKPGKRNYMVKDANGARWSVKPQDVQKMAVNQPCLVEYTIFQGDGGFSLNMVERVDVVQGTAQQAPQQFAPAPQQLPGGVHTPQAFLPTYQQPEDPKAEEIFVTGIVGRSMQSGAFSIDDIPRLTNMAVYAWRNRGADLGAEIQDEVPY